ncbi:LacI family DNA-binding transcriptional regulator [bacterium]|nr:LacI family DNA-binding transcriptional regulator [bacterium]
MTVTINDIAKIVGVSKNTVSRALNDKTDISAKTKRIILKTAKDLNYTPNYIARSLVKKETNTIGVLIPNISDSFYTELLTGIEHSARKSKYNIILSNTNGNSKIEIDSIRMLLEMRVDGMLICPTEKNEEYIDLLQKSNVPWVLLKSYTDLIDCDTVYVDVTQGAYQAVNHLIQKGYKKIYHIYSMQHKHDGKQRIEGCKKAFFENKIPLTRLKLIHSEWKHNAYYNAVKENINCNGKRIGIFAYDDEMALSVCKAVVDKGLKIPEDVGVIGYDNIVSSEYYMKSLTTVDYPKSEIGSKGAELLIKRMKSKKRLKPKQIVLMPKLIIREST